MENTKSQLPDEVKLRLANQFLTALKTNDWDLMRSVLSNDATWTLPGVSLLSGEAAGADAVIDRARKLKKFGVKVQLNHILYGLNSVVLSLHNTAEREELKLDQYVAIVCDLQEGKISKLTTHLSDVNGINTFFTEGII